MCAYSRGDFQCELLITRAGLGDFLTGERDERFLPSWNHCLCDPAVRDEDGMDPFQRSEEKLMPTWEGMRVFRQGSSLGRGRK